MKKILLSLALLIFSFPPAASATDPIVTRNFSGLWDQPAHESQGINLQIVDQAGGTKAALAYWFTYGDDMMSAWFVGVGSVNGNRVSLTLFEGAGVGFLESNSPGDDRVSEVGSMVIDFSSCDDGVATFNTQLASVGSGSFAVERLTDLFRTDCSGGISDDTPPGVQLTEERIALLPARAGSLASGHADFEERADRTEFKVEAEDVPDGNYRIFVGGIDRGGLVVTLGEGETEFRSPVEAGKILLTFDPRGQLIEVHDAQGAVLTSGGNVIGGGSGGGTGGSGGDDDDDDDDDNGGGNGGGDDDDDDDNGGGSGGGDGRTEIEVDLFNTGVYPSASGDTRYRSRSDRTDFQVEIEDVPVGAYGLRVGGANVGTIQVVVLQDGSVEGELEFRNPVEPGKILLDFDPRGQMIEVLDGSTVIMETLFPSS